MVLYKRKPIVLPDPLALPMDLNIFVWHIDETGEWFLSYEDYLRRLDFYTRHHFTCEITGTSCLTFFEALDSEDTQFKYVEDKFPLKLREPVARFLHFNDIRRLDALVEQVYAKFKNDFFPGEVVFLRKGKENNSNSSAPISNTSSQKSTPQPQLDASGLTTLYGAPSLSAGTVLDSTNPPQYQKPYIIKEKVQFNATLDPQTGAELVPGHCKYILVEEDSQPQSNGQISREASTKSFVADQSQIYRDRSTFTKHLIKCFFKITLQRASSKMGAPWCVKPEYLSMYGLTMDWPPELLKYKDDEPQPEATLNNLYEQETKDIMNEESKKIKNKKRKEFETDHEEDESEDVDNESSSKSHKKKKSNTKATIPKDESQEVKMESEAPTNIITSIVDDLSLPYQNKPEMFMANMQYYNNNLELIRLSSIKSEPLNALPYFQKLLQIYQFLNTFNEKLLVSNFNLDQFITSIKCTDPYELTGEVVEINVDKKNIKNEINGKDHNNKGDDDEDWSELSVWKRNQKIRTMIQERNFKHNGEIEYTIVKGDPASDDVLDNINNNGSAIFIESFVCLLSLFINEKGEWTTIVIEDWLVDENIKQEKKSSDSDRSITTSTPSEKSDESDKINSTKENEISTEDGDGIQSGSDNENDNSEDEARLDKCLNFRNTHWTERLTKRQFNNNYWLIILIGVLQDSSTIPKYQNFIRSFTSKIIPEQISSNILPKQLWRNFCRNLTISEKINSLWILVDIVTNFSPDIKSAVDDSLELSSQIRSERFRVTKDLKSATNLLANIDSIEFPEQYKEQEIKVEALQSDKTYLDKKLMENDFQRLKPLGMDRFGNRYFWFSMTGVPSLDYSEDELKSDEMNFRYYTGRLFVQGPSRSSAKFFLKLSDEDMDKWHSISATEGKERATKDVFHIYKHEDGTLRYIEPERPDVEIELVSKDGIVNPLIELSPIQRKIVDESPEFLLLDDETWYSVDRIEDLTSILDWLDTWGRREHDLLRQFKSTVTDIENSIIVRKKLLDNPRFAKYEETLTEELAANELSEAEINIYKQDPSDVVSAIETSASLEDGDDSLDTIESKLDEIADEIMTLEDTSKTRKVLTKISELEQERDHLLQEKEKKVNSERPGTRIMARTEKKRNKVVMDNKISKQAQILTDLINYRHFKAMEDVISWKNKLAIAISGSELRKNPSSSKKSGTITTSINMNEKMESIIENLSKTKNSEEV